MTLDYPETLLRHGLLFGCVCWLLLTAAPPVLGALGWAHADALRWLLSPVCHQIAERSIHVLGEPLGVCARCTGLYVGFTAGVAAWPHLPRLAAALAARPRWILAFMAPLAVDFLVPNTSVSRFATGFVAAFPAGLLPLLAIADWTGNASRPNTNEN